LTQFFSLCHGPLRLIAGFAVAYARIYESMEVTELVRAINDGAKVRACHALSLLDNFEWNDGFSAR
jgi:hypothetical protein